MNHKLEVQITSDPGAIIGQKNPAERYADKLLEDAQAGFQKHRWDVIPNEHTDSPTLLIIDETEGLVSHLSHGTCDGKFVKYVMTTTKAADGSCVYSSMEMVSPGEEYSVLADIYTAFSKHLAEQENHPVAADSGQADDEDDSDIVDDFVQALLDDARAYSPKLYYMRKDDVTFVCESFGISETRIVLQKQRETQYKVSLEYPDGSEVIGCTESCSLDTQSSVRELYQLIEQRHPETDEDLAVKDVTRFISQMKYQEFLTRVLSNAVQPIHTKPKPGEKRYLVMDIIRSVSPRVITRQLIDEITMRYGVLQEAEALRLRQLIESTISAISNLRREPNGFVFTTHEIPLARDGENRPSRRCSWSSNLNRISNAWTTWPAELFKEADMTSKTVLTRCAVLLMAAILSDQLKPKPQKEETDGAQ